MSQPLSASHRLTLATVSALMRAAMALNTAAAFSLAPDESGEEEEEAESEEEDVEVDDAAGAVEEA